MVGVIVLVPALSLLSAGAYRVTHEVDLRCYPNYSFDLGDIDGDGRKEMISLSQSGNRLRAMGLDGTRILEKRISNHGNWGTAIICAEDLDGDGRDEIIVPSIGRGGEALVLALDARGAVVRAHGFGTYERDKYGIRVPLLKPMRIAAGGPKGIVAAVAGGIVVALDSQFKEVWRTGGFRRDFEHELFVADLDRDGLDEVLFSTVGERGGGDFVILDHNGAILLRKPVSDYVPDTHFDDVAVADFRGRGQTEILVEKGLLLDAKGGIIWDVTRHIGHGQWIAHAPDPKRGGRMAFIAELWGSEGGSALFAGRGEKLWAVEKLPRTKLDAEKFPGWSVLPTRCHFVQWSPGSPPEIFFGEQTCSPTSHDCFETRRFRLQWFFLDLDGKPLGIIPFEDAQIEGYWYNGEVASKVADVDGDGDQEIVFPKQDGHAVVIEKLESASAAGQGGRKGISP